MDQKELEFKPAYDEQHIIIKKADVDLKVACCVNGKEEKNAMIAFCRLIHGPRICEPVEFDVPNQAESVRISMKAGQTKKLEVNCLFRLDIQGTEENSQTDAVIKERKVLSSSGIPSCKIMKDVLKLKMDHFSWAKIKIRIRNIFFRGKRMCFVPFKEKYLSLAKTPLILHANFYDDVEGNKEEV
nr:uncharacterized protein LOC129266962 [Lytechinus pictus]